MNRRAEIQLVMVAVSGAPQSVIRSRQDSETANGRPALAADRRAASCAPAVAARDAGSKV